MSSRDNWERLVAAVIKREQIWQLCHQHSISTISSDDSSARMLSFSNDNLEPISVHPQTVQLVSQENLAIHVGRLQRFSLHEIQAATKDFSEENSLPDAKDVYRGWLADGSQVAVKSYRHRESQFAKRRFLRGLEINSIAKHPNVLQILGFCYTPEHRLLVFPLMVNGSVATCLWGRHKSQPPLNWEMRKGIATGVAKGLVHLHEECEKKILHRDIKAENILLNADFEAVIADLELGVIVEHHVRYVEDFVCGTAARIAPEYYLTGECSEKSDVYGYGMFLLELITGQRHINVVRVKRKYKEREWDNIVDANDGGNFKEDLVEQLIQIALICISHLPEDRFKMSEVLTMLEAEDGLGEKWEECFKMSEVDMMLEKKDGLAEKWEEWDKKSETSEEENKNKEEEEDTEWKIVDDDVVPEELSGPR